MKELCADGVNTLEFPDFIKMLYKRIKQKVLKLNMSTSAEEPEDRTSAGAK